MIFQAEWHDGRRVRKPITFTVIHKNRPPVVEDMPVFYVKQGAVNNYQISSDYVNDPDQDPLVFKSIQSQMPEGAVLSSGGLMSWNLSRSQFNSLRKDPIIVPFLVEDQPEKAETSGKVRIAITQQDLPPDMLIVPGDSTLPVKEDERVNLKIYVTDPNGDDDIKVIAVYFDCLCFARYRTVFSGCSEFPNNHFFIQFTLCKHIFNMLADSGF